MLADHPTRYHHRSNVRRHRSRCIAIREVFERNGDYPRRSAAPSVSRHRQTTPGRWSARGPSPAGNRCQATGDGDEAAAAASVVDHVLGLDHPRRRRSAHRYAGRGMRGVRAGRTVLCSQADRDARSGIRRPPSYSDCCQRTALSVSRSAPRACAGSIAGFAGAVYRQVEGNRLSLAPEAASPGRAGGASGAGCVDKHSSDNSEKMRIDENIPELEANCYTRAQPDRSDSKCLFPARCDVIHHACWRGGQHA